MCTTIVALGCCFFISTANACLGRINEPNPSKPQLYKSIFIAKVESFNVKRDLFFYLDVTPAYEAVLSKPIKTIHGKEQLPGLAHINGGCGIPSPQAGKVGVFFVSAREPNGIEPLFYDELDGKRLKSVINKVLKAVNALDESKPSDP